jgi:hypothetical protein
MELNIKFANPGQREFVYSTARNSTFSGGFNNGKTFAECVRKLLLHSTFPNYRSLFGRQTYTALRKTTMQTFFNVVPNELIESHNEQVGATLWKNGGITFWLHLDNADENTLRGFEVNEVGVDQAEETEEKTFDILDARVGRWSGAIIPEWLLDNDPDWPVNELTGKPVAPSYHSQLCNPDLPIHYIYRKGHPDSEERDPLWHWISGEWDKKLGSEETYLKSLNKDPEWVARYMKGEWGYSDSGIHVMPKECVINPDDYPWFIEEILKKGNLFRIMDHGDSSPTCCLWAAAYRGVHIFYREYYTPSRPISYHRQAINDLSGNEQYSDNYADPQIFKKTAQKDGGFWSVAEEYNDDDIKAPPLFWSPADNNEFATRNRINELLLKNYKHPITGEPGPGIYFIKKTQKYQNGCQEAHKQLQAQKKTLLDTINGKAIYTDDRDDNVVDHAYDCIRYYVAMHGTSKVVEARKPPPRSFARFNTLLALNKLRSPVSLRG